MTAVDVWCLRLAPDAQAEHDARSLLTADEQRAADRYRSADDRAAHTRARALLRTVLARSNGCDPRAVEIGETDHGKPVIAHAPGPRFSVAHSRALAVVATCATTDIGVDVEPRRAFAWREVAVRFFAPTELDAIDRRPPALQVDAFFATWVRKEAYLKGIGLGFQDVSAGFEVPLADGPVRDPARAGDGSWYLHGLDLGADHAAALAVAGGPATVAVRDACDV